MSEKTKNVIERSVKTFIEVGVTTLIAGLSGVDITVQGKNRTFWVGLGVSAASAALSAAWNGIIQPWLKETSETDDESDNGA